MVQRMDGVQSTIDEVRREIGTLKATADLVAQKAVALEAQRDRVLSHIADAVEKVRAGNDKAIGAIVGAVMRETKGRADGGEVQRLIRERL